MTLADFGITEPKLFALITLYGLLGALVLVGFLVFFYLKGFGIYKMSRKFNIKRSWYGFVPFANIFAFGRLVDFSGPKKSSYRTVLTLVYVISILFATVGVVLSLKFGVELLFAADEALFKGKSLDPNIFNRFVPAFITLSAAVILNIVYRIIATVCAAIIYKRFDFKFAVVKAILGFIIPFLMPCFIYSVCKNDPIYSNLADYDDSVFKIDG